MTTEITTAARRIARTAGEYGPRYRLVFAADGTMLDAYPVDLTPATPREYVAPVAGSLVGGSLTQRGAQDHLDAWAAHPGDPTAQGGFLDALALDREGDR